jgi:DNA polymerase-3 subunit delta'
LLPTVRSRCQRVTFAPLDSTSMGRWLRSRPDLALTAKDLEWLSAVGEGSPGEIVNACERGIVGWRASLEPLLDRAASGTFQPELGPLMHKLADEWAKADVEKNPNASKETANRVGGRLMLRLMAERLRRRLHDESARRSPSLERVTDAIDAVNEAERMLDANVNGLFVMEAASVGVARALGQVRAVAAR